MKLSIVSNNEDFQRFLEERTTGIQILNRYRTFSDERELARFHNDFNLVDVFLFLDFQDLSIEFKEFLDYLHNGKSYFLNAEEVLIITWQDESLSPTPDLNKNLKAIEAYMQKLNINLRVVRLETLKFQDIYKSITISDSVKDNAPKQFIKYKVMHNSEGITIPPKKAEISIIPDKLKGQGATSKIEDLQTAPSLEHTSVPASPIVESIRTEKEFKDYLALSLVDTTIVFITGLRYSGKTTLALKCAKEFEDQNIQSAVIDLTARKDLRLLNKSVGCELSVLKGLAVDSVPNKTVLGVEVYQKVQTCTFLTELLKHITTNRAITFCEVDPEDLPVLYKTFRGNKVTLFVVPNSITAIRDSISLTNQMDFHVVPVANNIFKQSDDINELHLKDAIIKSRAVFNMEELSDLTGNLLR